MTDKIKENAIKISKLIDAPAGAFVNSSKFEEYNGLMPIVFECNMSNKNLIYIYPKEICLIINQRIIKYHFTTEPEFILALQECIIKYLEVKNGI